MRPLPRLEPVVPTFTSPPYGSLSAEMLKLWEQAARQWWDHALSEPAVLGAMGRNFTAAREARRAWRDQTEQFLEQLHMPSRRDLTRVLKIASRLEDKLLALEDRLDTLDERLDRIEKAGLQARVEAAEARLAARETTEVVGQQLDALLAKLEAPTKRSATRRKSASPGRSSVRAKAAKREEG